MQTVVFDGKIDKVFEDEWNSFVENHPDGNIFQTSWYLNLFSGQTIFRPVYVMLLDGEKNIKGVLGGVIQYQSSLPLKNMTSRCVIMGGPLVRDDEPETLALILNAFDKYICRKTLYAQFRNLYDRGKSKPIFGNLGYEFEDHLNVLTDLNQTQESLWKDIFPQKRNKIRGAIRAGLTVRPMQTLSDLKVSYEILKGIYKNIKLPIFPFTVFQNVFNDLVPKGMATFFGAYDEDKLIGTIYTLCYKGRIYDYFAGSQREYYRMFPNSLLPWEVFLWGKVNNMNLFDWGGAGKPGIPYGVRNYKEEFGGKPVNYGRFVKVYHPLVFSLAERAFKIKQRMNF